MGEVNCDCCKHAQLAFSTPFLLLSAFSSSSSSSPFLSPHPAARPQPIPPIETTTTTARPVCRIRPRPRPSVPPPPLPADPAARRRAVELVGALTQTARVRPRVRAELAALLGADTPLPSCRDAQLWRAEWRRARSRAPASAPASAPPVQHAHRHWPPTSGSSSTSSSLIEDEPQQQQQQQQQQQRHQHHQQQQQRQQDSIQGEATVRYSAHMHHRRRLVASLQLPTSRAATSRAFVLLDAARRALAAERPLSPVVRAQLHASLGAVPASALEAHRFTRALVRLDARRRASERWPPSLPSRPSASASASLPSLPTPLSLSAILIAARAARATTGTGGDNATGSSSSGKVDSNRAPVQWGRRKKAEELRVEMDEAEMLVEAALRDAHMLLGTFEVRGSVGAQTERLRLLLGGQLPRDTNVARSWKRVVAATIRKRARERRRAAKRASDEQKRLQRRLKRLKLQEPPPEQTASACVCACASASTPAPAFAHANSNADATVANEIILPHDLQQDLTPFQGHDNLVDLHPPKVDKDASGESRNLPSRAEIPEHPAANSTMLRLKQLVTTIFSSEHLQG